MGLLNSGKSVLQQHGDQVKRLLDDQAPEVALTAAEILIKFNADAASVAKAKQVVVKHCDMNNGNVFYALTAVNIVDRHLQAFETEMPVILALPSKDPKIKRGGGYIERMFESFKLRMKSQ